MKTKSMKKVLTVVLAVTMVMGATLTVCARATGSSTPTSSGTSTVDYVAAKTVTADKPIAVAGVEVKTSVEGVYAAETVQGAAISTPKAELTAALGLKGSQTAAIILFDTDQKKSNKAMASLNAAAEALGGEIKAVLDIKLGAKDNGKWVDLPDGKVAMVAGLPKGADPAKTYVAVKVVAGGAITILEDKDTNPNTITFEVGTGLGAYAIVAK